MIFGLWLSRLFLVDFLTCGWPLGSAKWLRFYEKYEFPYVFASNLDWEEWHLFMAGQPGPPPNVPPSRNKGLSTIGLTFNKALFNPYFWRGHVRGGIRSPAITCGCSNKVVIRVSVSGEKRLQGPNSRKIGSLLLKESSLPHQPSQNYSDLGRGHPKGLLIATKSWVSLTFTSFNTSKHGHRISLHTLNNRLFRPNSKR